MGRKFTDPVKAKVGDARFLAALDGANMSDPSQDPVHYSKTRQEFWTNRLSTELGRAQTLIIRSGGIYAGYVAIRGVDDDPGTPQVVVSPRYVDTDLVVVLLEAAGVNVELAAYQSSDPLQV